MRGPHTRVNLNKRFCKPIDEFFARHSLLVPRKHRIQVVVGQNLVENIVEEVVIVARVIFDPKVLVLENGRVEVLLLDLFLSRVP